MVIGKGLIASIFANYIDSKEILIFASGVSDSTETRTSEFERELKLVNSALSKYPNMLFVYFSTYSIDDVKLKGRPYTQHKLKIENRLIDSSSNYLICRLSNIVGAGGNSSNIFNFIVDSVKNEVPISVWKNASRSILGIDDMKSILMHVIEAGEMNKIITIANENNYNLPDLVHEIELYFKKDFIGTYLDSGSDAPVDVKSIKKYLDLMDRDFSINYINYLLKTYYPCQ